MHLSEESQGSFVGQSEPTAIPPPIPQTTVNNVTTSVYSSVIDSPSSSKANM